MNLRPGELVKAASQSQENYKKVLPILLDSLKTATLLYCKEVISMCKKLIKEKNFPPENKLRVLNLFHEGMLLGKTEYIMFAQKKMMSRLIILAAYKKESKNPSRGADLFGTRYAESPESRHASEEFLRTLLQDIYTWASLYGKGPNNQASEYLKTYKALEATGVAFPKIEKSQRRASLPPTRRITTEQMVLSAQNNISFAYDVIGTGNSEVIRELQFTMKSQKNGLEVVLESLLTKKDAENLELVMQAIEQIEEVLRSMENLPLCEEVKSPEKPPEDLLNLDESPLKGVAFVTAPPSGPSILLDEEPFVLRKSISPEDFRTEQINNKRLQDLLSQENPEDAGKEAKILRMQQENASLRKQLNNAKSLLKEKMELVSNMRNPQSLPKPVLPFSKNENSLKQPYDVAGNYSTTFVKPEFPDNPFGSSSSESEDSMPEGFSGKATISNQDLYQLCSCFDQGILYDDPNLQVAFQLRVQGELVACSIYIGNKTGGNIEEIRSGITPCTSEGLSVQIDKQVSTELIGPGAKTAIHITATMNKVCDQVPILNLDIKKQGPMLLHLKLPITLLRFIRPLMISSEQVLVVWEDLHSTQTVANITFPKVLSPMEITPYLILSGSFAVYSPSQIPFLTDNQYISCGVCVGQQILIQLTMTELVTGTFAVRSKDALLSNAYLKLIHEIISGKH